MTSLLITETPRLLLRRFIAEDLDAVAELFGDPRVMRFSTKGQKNRSESETWLRDVIAAYEQNGWGQWAVVAKDEGDCIGFCGLKQWTIEGVVETEIGYRLLASQWGRGLGTEASAASRDLGFERYGFTRLISLIEAENVASWRVAEKVGMHHEKDVEVWSKTLRMYVIHKSDASERR